MGRSRSLEEYLVDAYRQLQDVDDELGTSLRRVFASAATVKLELAGVFVDVVKDEELDARGLPDVPMMISYGYSMQVVLPHNLDHYDRLVTGYAAGRMAEARDHIVATQGFYDRVDAMNVAAAHELGHAHERLGLIEQLGIERADEYMEQQRRTTVWGLPLCMESAAAEDAWVTNQGGYRTALEGAGYDSESFGEALVANARAYSLLPAEVHADNFAALIARAIY